MSFFTRRSYGDPVHCRKALHRAVQCTSDYPEHVCEVLLTFERVEGESRSKDDKLSEEQRRFHDLQCASAFRVLTCRFSGGLGPGGAEDGDPAEQG